MPIAAAIWASVTVVIGTLAGLRPVGVTRMMANADANSLRPSSARALRRRPRRPRHGLTGALTPRRAHLQRGAVLAS